MDELIPVDILINRLEELRDIYKREGLTLHEELAHRQLVEYKDLLDKGHNYLIVDVHN